MQIPKIWNSTVYIIGGGPSVNHQDLSLIYNKRVIAVNNAYLLGNWIDAHWFGDNEWYTWHKQSLSKFKGLKFTCCTKGETNLPGIRFIGRDFDKPVGITKKKKYVSWNLNSGASAINLAYHLGASRIVLLGFDMQPDKQGITHWHRCHKEKQLTPMQRKNKNRKLPYNRFLSCFSIIAKDAKDLGIEIINTSLDSQIVEFPKMTLEEVVLLDKDIK